MQNVQYSLWYIASLFCSRKHFSEHLFLQVVSMVRSLSSYFVCMLFSCTLNRIYGVKQLVAFFAASAENISFIMHRHTIIRAFITWICVASSCGTDLWFPLLDWKIGFISLPILRKIVGGSLFVCDLNTYKNTVFVFSMSVSVVLVFWWFCFVCEFWLVGFF